MRRAIMLVIFLAAALVILTATLDKWSGRVGISDSIALDIIFAVEFLLFVGMVVAVRHHRAN